MACAPWLLGAYTANIRLIPGIQTRESYEGGDFDQYVARLKDLQVREPEEIPEPTFATSCTINLLVLRALKTSRGLSYPLVLRALKTSQVSQGEGGSQDQSWLKFMD